MYGRAYWVQLRAMVENAALMEKYLRDEGSQGVGVMRHVGRTPAGSMRHPLSAPQPHATALRIVAADDGSDTVIDVPAPSCEVTSMRPPCSWTMR